MDILLDPQAWIAFVTLVALELVLGIDNIVFISILAGKLREADRGKARLWGLTLAMLMRIALLFSISWISQLRSALFTVAGHEISGRDLIFIAGGLFLLAKSTLEIHQRLEGEAGHASARVAPSFAGVIVQIILLDVVFSLDSVITAVGMVNQMWIMVAAVVVSVVFMMLFSGPIGGFVERHPTVKMLALSFLLLIGLTLILDGLDVAVPKGYVYFAIAFSVFVEMLNLRMQTKSRPLKLREAYTEEGGGAGAAEAGLPDPQSRR